MTAAHPRPDPDPEQAPFWAACAERRLEIQHCDGCGVPRFPARASCPDCGSQERSWRAVSGRGTVWSWTRCYPPVLPAFAGRAPYDVVVVRLDVGPFLVSNLVAGEPSVGLPVEVRFVEVEDGFVLPQFAHRP
jgi:hypothetical protein